MEQKTGIEMVDFGLKDLRVTWSAPLPEGKKAERKIDIGYEIQQIATSGLVRIDMTFADVPQDPNAPEHYELSVRALGFFKLDENLPIDEQGKLLYGNGLAMLFSSLRGVLLPVSSCFPPGFRYILPTVNLREVVKEVEAKRKAHIGAAKPLQAGKGVAESMGPQISSKPRPANKHK